MNTRNFSVLDLLMTTLFSNTTNQTISWLNSSEQTLVVILYNQSGSPVRASRLLPNQSLSVPPGYFIDRLS